jgi:diguanylate cyclase (GGDEF)-like protein
MRLYGASRRRALSVQIHPTKFINMLRDFIESVREMASARVAWLLIKPVQPGFSPAGLFVSSANARPDGETEKQAVALITAVAPNGESATKLDSHAPVHYYADVSDNIHLFHISVSNMDWEESACVPRENRRLNVEKTWRGVAGNVWIGLRYDHGKSYKILKIMADEIRGRESRETPSALNGLSRALTSGARMAWQIYFLSTLLRDPTTNLPRRAELQTHLKRLLAAGADRPYVLGLALINPDEFEQVNQRWGRERGDTLMREIADLIQANIRQSDRVYHYGSAMFAVTFEAPSTADVNPAVAHLRDVLNGRVFCDGAIKLNFSIGVSAHEFRRHADPDIDQAELQRRADCALNAAKVAGGAQIMVWTPQGFTTSLNHHDRLSGIFTADTKKDYRNMLLLWDTVQVIASQTDLTAVANEFVERVRTTFKPQCAALIAVDDNLQPRFLSRSLSTSDPRHLEDLGDIAQFFTAERRHLIARAQKSGETEQIQFTTAAGRPAGAEQTLAAYAVPLNGGNHHHSCLYVDGPRDEFCLDSSDLVFLKVLAKQVAVALERCDLASRWRRERERESHRLREEVRGLRQALDHSKLVYQSAQMESLLKLLRKVAPTDATVLITGESGTGKEMIARSLHQQSRRHAKPFITVDFGAISPGLLETELFGHAKGAFTGAGGASLGRIAQAESGTVFLDEIGEIPLDVQAKLLRFLQEKEITPVGAPLSRKVDVRIVAATNRDLAQEVAAGRFRRDLYYRLKVVEITAPPLRQRPDDILPLTHYFLEKLAIQYDKRVRRLSPEVATLLLDHPWPGNVRELQNRLLQAVITGGDEELTPADFSLGSVDSTLAHNGKPADRPSTAFHEPPDSARAGRAADSSAANLETWPQTGGGGGDPGEDGDPWTALRAIFARLVATTVRHSADSLPLGVWLDEDLVLAADAAHGGVGRQAAAILGMAETTFRRHLEKAQRATGRRTSPRHPLWAPVVPVLERLARATDLGRGENILKAARKLLLREIRSRLPDNDRLGSVLLGVTVPTYRRWNAELERGVPAASEPGPASGSPNRAPDDREGFARRIVAHSEPT